MTKLRTGIIGTGKVAHTHAKVLAELDESEFVAVSSRTLEKSQAFASEYAVQGFDNITQMIEQTGVEAVTICTPHPIHALSAIEAIRLGVHCIIEKPLASSLEDCDAIINAAAKYDTTVAMISQRRLYEPVVRVREAITAGKIGTPVLGVVTIYGWRDKAYYESDPWRGTWQAEGGGVLVNQAVHQIDILQWYMGGDIAEVFGYWDNFNHPYIEVDDTAAALIRLSHGGIGVVIASNSQNPAIHGRVEVFGSNGASVGVQTDGGAMFIAGMSSITEPPYNHLWTVAGEQDLLQDWREQDNLTFARVDATQYYHKLQIQDFLQASIEGHTPMVTAEEGRKTVEIFSTIYKSQKHQRPVSG